MYSRLRHFFATLYSRCFSLSITCCLQSQYFIATFKKYNFLFHLKVKIFSMLSPAGCK